MCAHILYTYSMLYAYMHTVVSYIFSQFCPLSSLKIQYIFFIASLFQHRTRETVRTVDWKVCLFSKEWEDPGRSADLRTEGMFCYPVLEGVLTTSGNSPVTTDGVYHKQKGRKTASMIYYNSFLKDFIIVEYKTFKLTGIYSILNIYLILITV